MELTLKQINSTKLSWKEEQLESRRLSGYNVFILRFFEDVARMDEVEKLAFQTEALDLDMDTKENQLRDGNEELDNADDEVSLFKIAAKRWSKFSDEIRDAWNRRATRLNDRPVDVKGKFLELPPAIVNDIGTAVSQSLSREWMKIRKQIYGSIVRFSRRGDGKRQYLMPLPVALENQTYRSDWISYIMALTLFGRFFSRVHESERILLSKNAKSIYFHLRSHRRINELLTLDEKSAAHFISAKTGEKYLMAPKVVVEKKGKKRTGYVLDEVDGNLKITCYGSSLLELSFKSPTFDNEKGYTLSKQETCEGYKLVEFSPIMIQYEKDSTHNWKILFNLLCVDVHDPAKIIETKSS